MAEKTREEAIRESTHIRSMSATLSDVDVEKRMAKFSFASELPVERWDWNGPYDEILRVDETSADLGRMNSGGALLSDHNREKQPGVIEKAWVGGDRRAYVIARFSTSQLGEQELQDVANGIRRNVSFAYKIKDFTLQKGESGKRDVVTATSWEVLEVSLVSVPADPSVGIGRSLPEEKNEQGKVSQVEPEQEKQERVVNKMKNEEQGGTVTITESREDQILAFGRTFGVDERWLKSRALDPSATVESIRKEMQEMFKAEEKTAAAPETPEGKLGLTEKETRSYSICRAVMAQIDPVFEKQAGFERECHEAMIANGLKTQAGGFFVPNEVLTQKRTDLSVAGGLTLGGALVGTDHMPESFIDILRNNMATVGLGITVLSGLTGNPSIPRQDGAGTGYWIGEGAEPTESNITLGQIGLNPKTVGAVQEFTRQLLIQSAPSVDMLVMNDIAAVLARTIDAAIIAGTGSSNQPKGVENTTGVDELDQIGAVFSFEDAVAFETAILEANAGALGALTWLCRPSVAGALKTLQKTPGAPTGRYLLEGGQLNGYDVKVSTQVTAAHLLFGAWSQVIFAEWGNLEIVANDRGGTFRKGNIEVRGLHMCDVAVRYPQAFKKLTAFSSESSS